ncbi:hypothetical protein [Tropicimonas sp. IMCC6043]|uniref:hypothetical protein n=1 Tax=Tropicimonas sp. IMCC6043 TaxID=2510645 RepID=UPI00101DF21B|nr:hypothetical protein [Tropicimonas sp. IMCC6043]RYH09167.1 hypothetical protein EU800_13230 [Tropicimonas sp. IMCC6043]
MHLYRVVVGNESCAERAGRTGDVAGSTPLRRARSRIARYKSIGHVWDRIVHLPQFKNHTYSTLEDFALGRQT